MLATGRIPDRILAPFSIAVASTAFGLRMERRYDSATAHRYASRASVGSVGNRECHTPSATRWSQLW